MTEAQSIIAANLRAERARKNMTLAQLSAACGVSSTTLVTLEAGSAGCRVETLQAIAGALGVTMAQLTEGPNIAS